MKKNVPIEYGKYYHIFNKGLDGQRTFLEQDDYEHFFNLASIFLDPIADTYAYAIMGNHFHFLVRIKEMDEIGFLNSKYAKSDDLYLKWKTFCPDIMKNYKKGVYLQKPKPEKMFQHHYSTYAKGFNSKYNQRGALFEHSFKRVKVNNFKYLKRLIVYIHNNPVIHKFVEDTVEYPWTSYLEIINIKSTKLKRDTILGWFDSTANFKTIHNEKFDYTDISDLIIE
jgi:putative transposase